MKSLWCLCALALLSCVSPDANNVDPELELGLEMNNVHQLFHASFSQLRVDLSPLDESTWEFGLETTQAGCSGELVPVGPGVTTELGDRVELRRADGFVEWYVNKPEGIEQGFTIEGSSCDTERVIEMRADGLTPSLHEDDVAFQDERGATVLGYAGLVVEDADGVSLAAHLVVDGEFVRIHIDDSGARYPLMVDPLITNEQAKLVAAPGMAAESFGVSVAVDGDGMVVGAPGPDPTASGAVYVFRRDAMGAWNLEQRIAAPAGATGFGLSVDMHGTSIVVGAEYTNGFVGEAFVFVRAGGTWSLQQSLLPVAAGANDSFGSGVAIWRDLAVVGASGRGPATGTAHVFIRTGAAWTQEDLLRPAAVTFGMKFGSSVALEQDTAVVGAPVRRTAGGFSTGAAYVFHRNSCFGNFEQEAELQPADGTGNDRFGSAVAVSGGTIAVGSPEHSLASRRGAAYIYARTAPPAAPPCESGTWALDEKLTASDSVLDGRFGSSIAVSGSRLLVGSDGSGSSAGGYYFTRAASWTEETTLVASEALVVDLGTAAALGSSYSVLGASRAPGPLAANQGAVFVFDTTSAPNGTSCAVAGDCGSGFCVDGFCCDTACGGGSTMDCQACSVAAGAATDGVCGGRASGACDDGSACTSGDACAAGTCGGTATMCPPPANTCQAAMCDPATGACATMNVMDGTACDDGDGCTDADSCQAGACTAGTSRVCAASDACHVAGTCDPGTGMCSDPDAPDGTSCTDDDACTETDSCVAGSCVGAAPVVCPAVVCQEPSSCAPATGLCSMVPAADGTACPGGMCAAGTCVAGMDAGTDAGPGDAGTDAGPGMDAGPGDLDAGPGVDAGPRDAGADAGMSADGGVGVDASIVDVDVDTGCGCRIVGVSGNGGDSKGRLAGLALFGLLVLRRRRTHR